MSASASPSPSPDLSCSEHLPPHPQNSKKQKLHHVTIPTDHDRSSSSSSSLSHLHPSSPIHPIYIRDAIEDAERLMYQIENECKYLTNSYLHSIHPHLTTGMRKLIVDWMNECEEDFGLDHETYVCGVYYLDRYLSLLHRPLNPENYQLCASVALLISSKFHAILPIKISLIRAKAADFYRYSDYKVLELHMLQVLGYRLAIITPHSILQQMLTVFTQIPVAEIRPQAEFCCDAAFCEYDFLGVRPSVLALACILCACELVNCNPKQISEYLELILHALPNVFDMSVVHSIRTRILTLVHLEFSHVFQQQQQQQHHITQSQPTPAMCATTVAIATPTPTPTPIAPTIPTLPASSPSHLQPPHSSSTTTSSGRKRTRELHDDDKDDDIYPFHAMTDVDKNEISLSPTPSNDTSPMSNTPEFDSIFASIA